MDQKITYHVTGFLVARPGEHPPMIIEERVNGNTVNKYKAYDRPGDRLALFPVGRVIPSVVSLEKKEISIFQTRRDY